MNDAIRAAAKRLQSHNFGDEINADIEAVARFALAMTDELPVDEVWLRSLGFAPTQSGTYLRKQSLEHALYWVIDSGHLIALMKAEDTRTVTTSYRPTRGHLNALAAALGIELKEPAT